MSTLLILRVINAPRFLNRTGTDSIFSFRVACLREREGGEVFERIEYVLKDQFLLNWTGAAPAIFIYGDSPDRDVRSQGSLVIGLASSNAEDKFGLPAGFVSDTVETRIRTGARAALRESALATLDAAYSIAVRTSSHYGVSLPLVVGPEKTRQPPGRAGHCRFRRA